MTLVAFDFRKPPPGELGRQAVRWLNGACRVAAQSWPQLLPYAAELVVGPVEVVGAAAGLDALSDDMLAIPLMTPDSADGTVLLVFPRPVLLALLAGLVGETPAALPADRELTELELSLTGFLTEELFLHAFRKSWPVGDLPALAAGAPVSPRKPWTGITTDLILFIRLNITAPFGEQPVFLLVPRTGIWATLGSAASRPNVEEPAPTSTIEELVREMTVELSVVLGSALLSMQDVADLRVGDVVILRQKVDQPLDGLLAGTRKFRVWPGVVGAKAAVVIDTPTEED